MTRFELLEGVAVGASLAYLFDPDQGKVRRRALATRLGRATKAGLESSIAAVKRRAAAGSGQTPRVIAILRSPNQALGQVLRRGRRTPTDSWDIPMATVNIDIDQGTVTLRGAFPPVDEVPVEPRGPRRFSRATMHLVDGEE